MNTNKKQCNKDYVSQLQQWLCSHKAVNKSRKAVVELLSVLENCNGCDTARYLIDETTLTRAECEAVLRFIRGISLKHSLKLDIAINIAEMARPIDRRSTFYIDFGGGVRC